VKPAEFDYVAPDTLEGVIEALGSSEDAKIIAGGQSLVPLLNFRLARPTLLVDLRRVAGLDAIEPNGTTVRVGAMVRQAVAEHDLVLGERCPLVREALASVGHPQIRARGTIGGSIAHADPAAELPAMLLTLGGSVTVVGPRGRRVVHVADLFQGFFTTAVEADEVLVEVELPAAPARTGVACVEVARRAGDYALSAAMAQVSLAEDGSVHRVGLVVFGIGDRPLRLGTVEEALAGSRPSADLVRESVAAGIAALEGDEGSSGSVDYASTIAPVMARRALLQAIERAV
jgi:carbon-monoxide dehydrogenase medium subunit